MEIIIKIDDDELETIVKSIVIERFKDKVKRHLNSWDTDRVVNGITKKCIEDATDMIAEEVKNSGSLQDKIRTALERKIKARLEKLSKVG